MAIVQNKTLYVLNDSNFYDPLYTVNNEIFLTADIITNMFIYSQYKRAINSPLSIKTVRLYLLNEDESLKEDISKYICSYDIDLKYQQGQTRSANISLMNFDGKWTPNPISGYLWKNSKFKIDIGIYYNETVYWKEFGIYSPADPLIDDNVKTVSVQLYDKYALIDGTIGGNFASGLKIPVGTPIRQAIAMCLLDDSGNGKAYDKKPIIFPSKYEESVTPYTITKTPNITIGEIIIELANMIFCDVFYNETGNLVLKSGEDDLTDNKEHHPVQWEYNEHNISYIDTKFSVDYTKIVNKIIVYGAIQNGYQYKGIALNENAKSQSNITVTSVNEELIEDENIIGDNNCLSRAKYELNKRSKLSFSLNYKSVFIPHLVPNELISWTNSFYNIKNELFIITAIHINGDSSTMMDLSLTNLNEVAF